MASRNPFSGRRFAQCGLAAALAAGSPASGAQPLADAGVPPGAMASCTAASGPAVVHTGELAASAHWGPGVHKVQGNVTVPAGATLTVAGCTRVELARDANLYVSGRLVAAGTSSAPVGFVPLKAGRRWGAIRLNRGATADLAYTTITGGGGNLAPPQSGTIGAPLYVTGAGDTPLKVDHVTVQGATGVGITLIDASFDSASAALAIHGSGTYPLFMGADGLDTLPAGAYTGNGIDAVALQSAYFAIHDNARPILQDIHIRNVGVPYSVGMANGGIVTVGHVGSPPPLVTIDAGVKFAFPRGSSSGGLFYVAGETPDFTTQSLGALVALGTAADPVVFDSFETTPQAGDWVGLRFSGVDPRTRLDHVEIRHAGANSGVEGACTTFGGGFDGDAALQILFAGGEPPNEFLTNSDITSSAGSGIFRGWTGDAIDFVAGNTVTHVAWCTQTWVRDPVTGCPQQTCPTSP